MGKINNYILIMSGLMLLFYFTGLLESTLSSTLLNLLLDPIAFQNNSITINAIAIFSAIAVVGITVGFFSGTNTRLVLMGAFVVALLSLMWDFLAVVTKVFSTNPVIAMLLFSPLLILWVITVIEFWKQ